MEKLVASRSDIVVEADAKVVGANVVDLIVTVSVTDVYMSQLLEVLEDELTVSRPKIHVNRSQVLITE